MTQQVSGLEIAASMLLVKLYGLDTLTLVIGALGASAVLVLAAGVYELNRIANALEISLEKKA